MMAAPLSVCTKQAQCSLIWFCGLKVCQGPHSHDNSQHNMGTEFSCNGASMNGLKNKQNGGTSVTHEEEARSPSTVTNDDMVLLDK
jgi:hypothetical protein